MYLDAFYPRAWAYLALAYLAYLNPQATLVHKGPSPDEASAVIPVLSSHPSPGCLSAWTGACML